VSDVYHVAPLELLSLHGPRTGLRGVALFTTNTARQGPGGTRAATPALLRLPRVLLYDRSTRISCPDTPR
jgi:hypothetical protein